ncbi:hypothetical protein GCWU000324_00181 [Kingella oralis ATCC 51147]|uniref:Uncharacterized protein n=1 Tax=Kingella oralis ATCC 51147 TaxID=629741 RepID=C4GH51_9NEIS|nr:hypothetical protein GCWU000324_00181 [Kingella oralis ATCC 51147]
MTRLTKSHKADNSDWVVCFFVWVPVSGCLCVCTTGLGSLKTCFADLSYNSIFQRYFDSHDC